jgi:hypothetical protein
MAGFGPSNIFSSTQNVNAFGAGVSDIFAGIGDKKEAAPATAFLVAKESCPPCGPNWQDIKAYSFFQARNANYT